MAKKDEAEVIVDDEATVTIDVSDAPELAEVEKEQEGQEEQQQAAAEPKVERKRLKEPEKEEEDDEASKALAEAQALAAEEARKRQAAEARAAQEAQLRQAAERTAADSVKDADDARADRDQTQLALLESGIDSAQREVQAFESQLASAYEAGDFKAVASIQTKLSTAAAKVDRLTASKEAFTNQAETRKAAPTTEGRVVQQPSNQVESYLAQMAPAAQAWLREHPECMPSQLGGDATANSKMMAGHYAAQAQNIVPNTPDYFRIIEEHTGHRKAMSAASTTKAADQEDEAERPAPKTAKQPKVQPSAPPSREPLTARGQPSGKVSVTLSKDEQEMAKLSFPTLPLNQAYAAYARNKIELQAEGKLGRTTH